MALHLVCYELKISYQFSLLPCSLPHSAQQAEMTLSSAPAVPPSSGLRLLVRSPALPLRLLLWPHSLLRATHAKWSAAHSGNRPPPNATRSSQTVVDDPLGDWGLR